VHGQQWLFKILLTGLVPVVTALLVEVSLRIDGRYKDYNEANGRPYISVYQDSCRKEWSFRYPLGLKKIDIPKQEFAYSRTINDIGFTDHRSLGDIDTLPEKVVRILALGDSFTEGVGVTYEETWPRVLENLLNQTNDNTRYMVYNAGVGGCDPFFEFQNLKLLDTLINPSVVINLVNSSDFEDVYLRGGWNRFKNDGTVEYEREAPGWEPVYRHSHLIRAILRSVLGYNPILTRSTAREIYNYSSPHIFEALDSSESYCRTAHITWIPVFNPIPFNNTFDKEAIFNDSLFRSELRMRQENFLDLSVAIYKCDLRTNFWKHDWHCTREGYDMFAREIFKHLQRAPFN